MGFSRKKNSDLTGDKLAIESVIFLSVPKPRHIGKGQRLTGFIQFIP